MKYKKETTYQQLHTLWIRMWDFAFRRLDDLDGDEVVEAIKAVSDPEHPFFKKLGEAFDTLRPRFAAEPQGYRWRLVGDDRSPIELLEDLEGNHRQTVFVTWGPELKLIFSSVSPRKSPQLQYVRVLKFNMPVSNQKAIDSAIALGYHPPHVESSLRVIDDYIREVARSGDINFGDRTGCGGGAVLFANLDDPARSVVIEGGGMGGYDVCVYDNHPISGIVVVDWE